MGDITDKGIGRLAYQYADSDKFKDFISGFLAEFEELETSRLQLLNERFLDVAVGSQLDDLGELVGQSRPDGASDDLYLLYIRAKIVQNRTAQTAQETLDLLSFMLGGSTLRYFLISFMTPAYEIYRELTAIEEQVLADLPLLLGIFPAYFVIASETDTFGFSDDPAAKGFGDGTGTVGGIFARIL